MDRLRSFLYYSCMERSHDIPVFNLFGETAVFPDVAHCERIFDRASRHDWVIAPHRHDHLAQVLAIESGQVSYQVDGVSGLLRNEEFLFVPLGAAHSFTFSSGTEGRVLTFPAPLLGADGPLGAEIRLRLSRVLRGAVDASTAQLLDLCARHFSSTGRFRAERLVALSQALLACLCEIGARDDADPAHHDERSGGDESGGANSRAAALMARLDDLLRERMHEGWGAGEYAAALSISTGHLTRLCRSASGMGASRYIDMAAITEACRLLAFTQMPVAEIGYQLGYQDPAYFSRRFRALRGETPSAYRARFCASGAVVAPN